MLALPKTLLRKLQPLKQVRGLAALVALIVVAMLVASFLAPQQPPQESAARGTPKQETERLFLGLRPEEWTALFTGLLTVSTIGLWVFTRKAAVIAERTLTELERPWFLITDVNHSALFAAENPRVEFVVRNFGKQVGIVKGIRGGSGSDRPTVNIDGIPQKEAATNQIGNMLAPIEMLDKHMVFSIPLKIAFTPQDRALLAKGIFEYVTRGVLLYRGLSRQECETGFCWRYDPSSDKLVRHGGEKYNFTV